jgi:hypothetical protein
LSAALAALVPLGVITLMSTMPLPAAGEIAVMLLAEFTVKLVAGVPPNSTAVAPVKPVPVMVTEVPPAVVPLAGLRPVIAGAAALIVNVAPDDVPPELVTVTVAVPGVAIRPGGTSALSCVALTKLLASEVVPHCTVVPESKFAPLMVRVNSAPPAVAEEGERLEIVGAKGTGEMVNVAEFDVALDSVAVTLAVPALAIRLAGTAADSCVELTTVVVSAMLPHCTVAPETKFAPLTVKVNAAPPAVAEAGERLRIVGRICPCPPD